MPALPVSMFPPPAMPRRLNSISPPNGDVYGLHFIELELRDADGNLISDNFYWRNGTKDLDYTMLNTLPRADVAVTVEQSAPGKALLRLKNNGKTTSFANRLRLLDPATGERVLPILMSDNYVTLFPGQEKTVEVDYSATSTAAADVMVKQYGHPEYKLATLTKNE